MINRHRHKGEGDDKPKKRTKLPEGCFRIKLPFDFCQFLGAQLFGLVCLICGIAH